MERMMFDAMIDEYSVPFTAFQEGEGYFTDSGDWVAGNAVPVPLTGVFLPFSNDELKYAENGTYSTKDRKILTTDVLEEGQKILHEGTTYTVQRYKDLSAFTDVNIYVVRWAG